MKNNDKELNNRVMIVVEKYKEQKRRNEEIKKDYEEEKKEKERFRLENEKLREELEKERTEKERIEKERIEKEREEKEREDKKKKNKTLNNENNQNDSKVALKNDDISVNLNSTNKNNKENENNIKYENHIFLKHFIPNENNKILLIILTIIFSGIITILVSITLPDNKNKVYLIFGILQILFTILIIGWFFAIYCALDEYKSFDNNFLETF